MGNPLTKDVPQNHNLLIYDVSRDDQKKKGQKDLKLHALINLHY